MGWWKSVQHTQAANKGQQSRRSRLLLQALEPRLMFDGAAVSTVAAVVHADIPPAERSLPDSPGPDSTHSGTDRSAEKIPALLESAQAPRQVVFIESNVGNYQSLIAQLPAGMEVVILDASKDGRSDGLLGRNPSWL
jgi:hypothetical protein